MRKLIPCLLAICVAAGATLVAASPAQAYQVPGSVWTWHRSDNVATGYYNMRLDFEDTNDLNNWCDHVYINGDSKVYRYQGTMVPASLELIDGWALGDAAINVNAPAGAGSGFSTSWNTFTWDTVVTSGTTWLAHNYRGPGQFSVSALTNFSSISHTSTGVYPFYGTYWRVAKERHETLC